MKDAGICNVTARNRLVFLYPICGFMHRCTLVNTSKPDYYFHLAEIAKNIATWCYIFLVGLVVGALAFHQCGPGSISAPGVICGLTLLVLYSALRGQSTTSTFEVRGPGTPVFPSHQKPTFDLICE